MAKYNVLIMGASYGSLLASKLLFAEHSVKLVCLPAEVEAINSDGIRVRLPIKGRRDPVELELAQAAGQAVRRRPRRDQSGRLRSRRPGDAGAAVWLARRARTAGCGGEVPRAVHVDHEHAAAALLEAHSRPEHRQPDALLHRRQRVGEFRARRA